MRAYRHRTRQDVQVVDHCGQSVSEQMFAVPGLLSRLDRFEALAVQQFDDHVQRLVHPPALVGGLDADLHCVVHQRSRADAKHH